MNRPVWSTFRDALEAVGFRPSKRFGQNFLLDDNMAAAIASDAGVARGTRVLEVGTGCGFLTLHLLERGAEVLSVEVDDRLFGVASELLAERGELTLIHADALAGKHRLAPAVDGALWDEGPWHLVANLPYSIAAPLLVVLARRVHPPASMTALVQREVAEKIAARPGQGDWGAVSARLGAAYRARPGRLVGRELFWPRPRVESRVVHLERLADPMPAAEREAFDRLVETVFGQRRKQVASSLRGLVGGRGAAEEILTRAGIDPSARPETLSVEALRELARAL